MWQLDGVTYPLAGGQQATVLQVIDDHSRNIVASLAAPAETDEAAENAETVGTVVRTGIARHGVPQRFLSDNGAALNPTRRKQRGQLVDYLNGLTVRRPGFPAILRASQKPPYVSALDTQDMPTLSTPCREHGS